MSSAGPYDPTEPEDRRGSHHISKRDLIIIICLIAAISPILFVVYGNLRHEAEKHTCKGNLGQIYKALSIYQIENNDRFPPTYVANEKGEPADFEGASISWMTVISPGLEARASFRCPTAQANEVVKNVHAAKVGETFESSYGLYRPWSAGQAPLIQRPESSVLIAETTTNGNLNTFDPNPMGPHDGISIDWDDQNFRSSSNSRWVTRLAFPNTSGPNFKETGECRHRDSIFILYASGSLGKLKPNQARVSRLGSAKGARLAGLWSTH